jgi:hypothetical protein
MDSAGSQLRECGHLDQPWPVNSPSRGTVGREITYLFWGAINTFRILTEKKTISVY